MPTGKTSCDHIISLINSAAEETICCVCTFYSNENTGLRFRANFAGIPPKKHRSFFLATWFPPKWSFETLKPKPKNSKLGRHMRLRPVAIQNCLGMTIS